MGGGEEVSQDTRDRLNLSLHSLESGELLLMPQGTAPTFGEHR